MSSSDSERDGTVVKSWPGMQGSSVAGDDLSSSQGNLIDGHIAMMSPQHPPSNMIPSPKQPVSVTPLDQQSGWNLPHPSPGSLANDMLRPHMNLPTGLAFGQHQLAASTVTATGGQLQLPSTSARKTSISNKKLLKIFKSSLESGALNRQKLLALISKCPALAEAIKQQKLMKSAAVAAAQNQVPKSSGSATCGSAVVVCQPQDTNRPSPILPIGVPPPQPPLDSTAAAAAAANSAGLGTVPFSVGGLPQNSTTTRGTNQTLGHEFSSMTEREEETEEDHLEFMLKIWG